jgi:protein SCO1/2
MKRIPLLILLSLFFFNDQALAESAPISQQTQKNEPNKEIGITENLGDVLNLNLQVRDESGKIAPLNTILKSGVPIILTPVYFACPGLCNFQLNGLVQSLKQMDWIVGENFEILAFSFDPREAELAEKKKESYVKLYGRPETKNGWHFVTADQATIDTLTSTVGFKYKWDENTKEWAHASAAIVLSPDGKITRYLHGIEFKPQDIKLSLMDAAEGKTGSFAEKATWLCYNYNPAKSKYEIAMSRVVPMGGGLLILIIMATLLPAWIRNKKHA